VENDVEQVETVKLEKELEKPEKPTWKKMWFPEQDPSEEASRGRS
jgi:hypothetical protein